MKKVLVVLADGFEEIEAVTPIDLCRRAGLEVTVAGVGNLRVTSKRGLNVTCDTVLTVGEWDALVLPGGLPGADRLAQSEVLSKILESQVIRQQPGGAWIAALCAAPATVLGPKGLLKGKRWTGYPGTDNPSFGGHFAQQGVVVDGTLLTASGVATAADFALELIRQLAGDDVAERVGRETLLLV